MTTAAGLAPGGAAFDLPPFVMAKAKLIIQPIAQKTEPQPSEQFSWLTSPDPYLSSQPQPTSQLSSREVEISGSVALGRAPDNTVCLSDDRIARYHAIIEERGGSFWLNDFGSAGGTLLNNAPVMAERPLRDGDAITLANAVRLIFRAPGTSDQAAPQAQPQNHAPAPPAERPVAANISTPAPTPAPASAHGGNAAVPSGVATSSSRLWQWGIPIIVLLVILGGGVMVKIFLFEKDCGQISFASPSAGTTFSGPLKIRLSAEQPDCIQQINLSFGDQTVGSVASESFEFQIDRQHLQNLQAGQHNLIATATTVSGGKLKQSSISLRLNYQPKGNISPEIISENARVLATEIEDVGSQIIFAPEFIEEIARATAAFISSYNEAAFQRARSQKQDILTAIPNQSFRHPAVGFILAFSRSQFSENGVSQGCGVEAGGIGFWRVPPLVEQYGSDKAVNQAYVALAHLRSLRDSVDGDLLYAIACFGESNARMPKLTSRFDASARRDLWAVYKASGLSEEEKNRVVCFFAAGIVAENPRLFDLATPSITGLYR